MSQGSDVVVVGSVNVDLVVTAPHLPAPGETVLGDALRTFGGGKGANAAVAAARAGATVHLVAAVGRDDHGRAARAELAAEGVDVAAVAELDGVATGVALIVVDAAGDNQITLAPGANQALTPEEVTTALATLLPAAGCVLVSTEIPAAAALAAVRAAQEAGVPCVLNPAPMIPAVADALALGPIVTPNATELAQLATLVGLGSPNPGVDVAEALTALAGRTGAPAVATLGGAGCLAARPDGTVEAFPAPTVHAVDTTGAGDTFNGVLAARLATGGPLAEAIATAVVAATLSVQAEGARTGMPTSSAIAAAARRP